MNTLKRRLVAALVALSIVVLGSIDRSIAAGGGEPAVQTGFSVALHGLGVSDDELHKMRAIGIARVRIDLFWSRIERTRGVYDWSEYDGFLDRLHKAGLRPILILAYNNGLYLPETPNHRRAAPTTDVERDAYTRWAVSAVQHYAAYSPIWEIWNEPDDSAFWPPKGDAEAYLALATRACRAIKSAHPHAVVIGPALASASIGSAGIASDFIRTVLRSDLPTCLDGVSIHTYFYNVDDRVKRFAADIEKLRALTKDGPAGRKLPIYITEWGEIGHAVSNSVHRQAFLAVAVRLFSIAAGIEDVTWYDWKDPDASGKEAFGLIDAAGVPKPAYTVLLELEHRLHGARYVGTASRGGEIAFTFERNGGGDFEIVLAAGVPEVKPGCLQRPILLREDAPRAGARFTEVMNVHVRDVVSCR
jgi:polysaccharide biosynthesis protein PslG